MHEPPDKQPSESDPFDPETLKGPILAAIAEHLREHGPKDWHLVCERAEFAHVVGKASGPTGARRFWRWRKRAGEEMPADRTRPREGRATNEEQRDWADEQTRRAAVRELPAPPQASFFMKHGADGLVKIDMLEAFTEIWSDLGLARHEAFEGPEGDRRPRSAKILTQTAMARMKALAMAVQLQRDIYGIDNLHRLYSAIFEFLDTKLEAYPELRREFLQHISELNTGQPMRLVSEGH